VQDKGPLCVEDVDGWLERVVGSVTMSVAGGGIGG
jgi:hypothetical protein